ncbi:hypothetical protein [Pendulispora rubella]
MILGGHHTCVLVGKGELMCWGQGTGTHTCALK